MKKSRHAGNRISWALTLAIAAGILSVSLANYAAVPRSNSHSETVSAPSGIYALIPVTYNLSERPSALKPAKKDGRWTRFSGNDGVTSGGKYYRDSVRSTRALIQGGHLHGAAASAFHQACLLLDVPPPLA